jgi:hypothetical protein
MFNLAACAPLRQVAKCMHQVLITPGDPHPSALRPSIDPQPPTPRAKYSPRLRNDLHFLSIRTCHCCLPLPPCICPSLHSTRIRTSLPPTSHLRQLLHLIRASLGFQCRRITNLIVSIFSSVSRYAINCAAHLQYLGTLASHVSAMPLRKDYGASGSSSCCHRISRL